MKNILIVAFLIIALALSGCSSQKTTVQQTPTPTNEPAVTPQVSVPPAPQETLPPEQPSVTPPAAPPEQTPAVPATGGLGIKEDVAISGFAFTPSTLTIPKGATVIWTNKDSAPHTIVSDSGDEIKSEAVSQGETYAHTFNTPGTYGYHCSIHPSMKGKIIVE